MFVLNVVLYDKWSFIAVVLKQRFAVLSCFDIYAKLQGFLLSQYSYIF